MTRDIQSVHDAVAISADGRCSIQVTSGIQDDARTGLAPVGLSRKGIQNRLLTLGTQFVHDTLASAAASSDTIHIAGGVERNAGRVCAAGAAAEGVKDRLAPEG